MSQEKLKNRKFTDYLISIFFIWALLSIPYYSWDKIKKEYTFMENDKAYKIHLIPEQNLYCVEYIQTWNRIFIFEVLGFSCKEM